MRRWKKFLFIKLPLLLLLLSLLWVTVLKVVPVYWTPLMTKRAMQYKPEEKIKTVRTWVPLERISPEMIKAVIASEDNRFAQHNGFDTTEIRKMFHQHAKHGKALRGCSTISQQTAKNVFTTCADTGWRKIVEAYYTFLIEKIWGKRRIMEVYLNVAEPGKGLYGGGGAEVFRQKRRETERLGGGKDSGLPSQSAEAQPQRQIGFHRQA